jgi:outer membrane protein with beta-barrel domain
MNRLNPAVLLGLVSLAMAAQAAEPGPASHGPRAGLLAQVDADFGGDDVATVYFEDDSSQDLTAGQGLGISLGGWFRPIADSPFEVQASFGYKFSTTQADNADIGMSRTLLQLEALYRWPNGFFVGAGLMSHMSPKLDGDGFFPDIDFDDATGFNAEIGWKWISVHYTNITYESDLFEDIDASHIGARFTWRFGAPY